MRFTSQATGPVPINGSIILLRRRQLRIVADGVVDMVTDDRRDDVGLLALLLPQPPLRDEGRLDAAGRVGAGDGPRPDPGDDGRLRSVGQLGPRVEVTDAPPCLLTHPLPVAAHVLGQAVRTGPAARAVVGAGEDRSTAGEARWDLDEGLVDEDGHGVEVGGVRLQAEPLGLQGDGAASGEGVEDRGRLIPRGAADLLPDLTHEVLIADVVPVHHAGDEGEQAAALRLHGPLGGGLRVGLPRGPSRLQELLVALGGVVDQLGEEHGAGGGRGLAGPPQVQRGGVPLADGFLPSGLLVDGVERQRHLNELPGHGSPSCRRRTGEFSAGVNGNILRPPSDTNHTLEPTVSLDSVSYRPATLFP